MENIKIRIATGKLDPMCDVSSLYNKGQVHDPTVSAPPERAIRTAWQRQRQISRHTS